MADVIPAILPTSVGDLQMRIGSLPREVKLIHLDVLENDVWEDIQVAFEAHLMVAKPEAIAKKWAERGAKRIIVHKLSEEVLALRGQVELGLAVELLVPLEEVYSSIPDVDFVLLMAIEQIGEQGHPFDERIFDRIKQVRERFPKIVLSVDGGVKVSNYQRLMEAGVDRLVSGSGFNDLWTSLTKS